MTQNHTGYNQRSQQVIPSDSKHSDVLFSMAQIPSPLLPPLLGSQIWKVTPLVSQLISGPSLLIVTWSKPSQPNVVASWFAGNKNVIKVCVSQRRRQNLESTTMAWGTARDQQPDGRDWSAGVLTDLGRSTFWNFSLLSLLTPNNEASYVCRFPFHPWNVSSFRTVDSGLCVAGCHGLRGHRGLTPSHIRAFTGPGPGER